MPSFLLSQRCSYSGLCRRNTKNIKENAIFRDWGKNCPKIVEPQTASTGSPPVGTADSSVGRLGEASIQNLTNLFPYESTSVTNLPSNSSTRSVGRSGLTSTHSHVGWMSQRSNFRCPELWARFCSSSPYVLLLINNRPTYIMCQSITLSAYLSHPFVPIGEVAHAGLSATKLL